MPYSSFYLSLVCLLLATSVAGQDVEKIIDDVGDLKNQSLTITGGLNLTGNLYGASGIDPRRDDFQWNARANLSLGFLGVSAPFSFAFSDGNQNFNLPSYTFVGISPTYKWATLHAGDRSLSLSRFTMDGITFRGAGLELKPGKFRAAAFAGRLNRALLSDLNAVGDLNGFYQRNAVGGKVGYEGDKGSINFSLFSAADDTDSNPLNDLDQVVTPVNNQVMSLSGRQAIGKRLTISGEAAHAVTDQDRNAPSDQSEVSGQAFQLDAFYNLDDMGLRAGYERIGRGFRTLGALFFNNDTERITAGANRRFLENKLNLNANVGLERTNIAAEEAETTNRIIASLNANYRPSDDWNFNAGYSNFRNDTKLRGRLDPVNPVDSIFLAQVTQSVNGMVLRRLGSNERPSSLSFVFNRQQANNIINDIVSDDNQTRFTNLAVSYARGGGAEQGFQWNVGFSTNFTELGGFRTTALAPAVGLVHTLADNKLTAQLQSAMSFVSSPDGSQDNSVFNLSAGLNYRLQNSHTIRLSGVYLNRFGSLTEARNFSEYYGTVSYGYRFGGSIGGNREQ